MADHTVTTPDAHSIALSAAYDEIIAAGGGTAAALADKLELSSYHVVLNWRRRGIPVEMAQAVRAITGLSLRRIRPLDWHRYWPEEPADATPAAVATPADVAADATA